MKDLKRSIGLLLLLAMVSGLCALAQSMPPGNARNFSSSSYYPSPHERQEKFRLTGAQADSLPEGVLEIRQLRIETFKENGKPEAIITAPHCLYMPMKARASSAGHIVLQTADGQVRLEGDGFLWQQSENSLIISNNVQTLIRMGTFKLPFP